MELEIKFYASLRQYLPDDAIGSHAVVEVPSSVTPADVIRLLKVPLERCHLVLVNGVYVKPEERGTLTLNAGDALAIWPPVAGG